MMSDPYIAVQNAMTPEAQAAAMAHALRMNPQLQGANLADVLDMYYENDGMLNLSEPFWEHHGDTLVENVPAHYLSAAVLAVGLMLRQPDALDTHAILTVELLAYRAAADDGALRTAMPDLPDAEGIEPDRGGGSTPTEPDDSHSSFAESNQSLVDDGSVEF